MSRPSWLPSVRRLSFAIVFALVAALVSVGAVASAAPAREHCTGFAPSRGDTEGYGQDINVCIRVEGNTVSGRGEIKPGSFLASLRFRDPPVISVARLKGETRWFDEEYERHEGNTVVAMHLPPGRYLVYFDISAFHDKKSKILKVTSHDVPPLNCPAGVCRR